ncbi:hypothetical protein [Metabacillus niabensis]|uniref:hypothetical protein n=1 Tax=Metabacillus TaxID=2675233 RepID=UPI000BA56803|nr:hypothetical protein CHH83_06730 [Bacillus sp. 7586-K]
MKKITDERLILQNLKNIRFAYMIQTAGIIGILGFDFITKGLEGMRENPLWLVFMITTVISLYLSMNISVDHEKSNKAPKKGLTISLLVAVMISSVVGFLVTLTDGYTINDGLVAGGILFLCSLVPVFYIYYLRTKQEDDYDE